MYTDLERRLRAHIPSARVAVTLTDNRNTMISVRRGKASYEVRVHHMFANTDPAITKALASYIENEDADAASTLDEFIDQNLHRVRPKTMITFGAHHDLREIFDDLNARYFEKKIGATITWGARIGQVRRHKSIRLGCYSLEDRQITIHRSLDRRFVPRFFVALIVFHEMLHHVHGVHLKNGRREFHSDAFRADERQYEHYDRAKRWERAHLADLMTY